MSTTTPVSSTFEFLGEHQVPSLDLLVKRYEHRATGARHFHLQANDDNNAFLVAFLTVPQDSTGVAHILEHTSLCGSQRFPVRDPFFGMLKRSLQTFMNAFTASDWTAYPFATRNAKDFDNLLQVYLDAAFFPKLTALDFAQEGHRLEFENPDDPDSPLVIKGVVYNEMKGAMGPAHSQVHQALMTELFPTITYHYNSGGDPEHIPDLTHEQLRAFHARHYHPSNAVFMTYGDIPAEHHHERFEALALGSFDERESPLRLYDEQRYEAPREVQQSFAVDGEENPDECHVVLGWLLGQSTDLRYILRANLLASVLLEHSASPLRAALETCGLGASPSELCGLDDDYREAVFVAGLEGTRAERAEEIEALILGVLQDLAERGAEREAIDSCLHQLELAQREVGGDHFPYGLNLMLRGLGAALHGGDPVAMLDLDAALRQLAEDAAEPGFFQQLVRDTLLDNPHRVRLTMRPSAALTDEREQRRANVLAQIRASMSTEQREQINEQARALAALQDAPDDSHLLPSVTLADIPEDINIPEPEDLSTDGTPLARFAARTNGLVYMQLVAEVPQLEPALATALPVFCDLLTEVGCAARDYRENQAWLSAYTGGTGAATSVRTHPGDPAAPRQVFTLRGKSLERNAEKLATVLAETLHEARFDEAERLTELVAQMRAQDEARVTDIGHQLAIVAATDGMTPAGSLNERNSGLSAIAALKSLDADLRAGNLEGLRANCEALGAALASAPRQLVLVTEPGGGAGTATAALEKAASALPPAASWSKPGPVALTAACEDVAWVVNSPVSFCAKVFLATPHGHADTPSLMVLATLLRSNFLHKEIREKGGAYGAGASYDPGTATFGFFSYRDPQLGNTLDTFDRSLAWAREAVADRQLVEAAILSVIGSMDRPASPAGEAIAAFHNRLHGRDAAFLRRLRRSVLDVTSDDLRRVLDAHLHAEAGRCGVVTNAKALEELANGRHFEVHEL